MSREQEALSNAPVYIVSEPVLSNAELSEIVGQMTARINSLCNDIATLDAKIGAPKVSARARAVENIKGALLVWLSK